MNLWSLYLIRMTKALGFSGRKWGQQIDSLYFLGHKRMLSCISIINESILTSFIPFESSFDKLSNEVQQIGLRCQRRDFKHLTSIQGEINLDKNKIYAKITKNAG